MAQPGAQPDEHEEAGRADIRLTVLHVGGDGAAQQPRDEEHPDRSSRREQKEQRAQRLPGRDQHQLSLKTEPVQLRDDLRYLGKLGAGAPDEREPAQKDQNVSCRALPFHGSRSASPRLVYNCHTSRPRLTMITGTEKLRMNQVTPLAARNSRSQIPPITVVTVSKAVSATSSHTSGIDQRARRRSATMASAARIAPAKSPEMISSLPPSEIGNLAC